MAARLKRGESPGANVSKLRMDRKPNAARINDPSHPAGKRKEIDNVMKKARQSNATNDYWDKKLLEVEEKDPNRWRHTGYKKLYIHGKESSSESEHENERDREKFRYNGGGASRKSPISRKSRSRSPVRRYPPQSPVMRKTSRPRSPVDRITRPKARPRSPDVPRRRPVPSTPPPIIKNRLGNERMGRVRPPSPPPKMARSSSSVTSCSDDSCSVCCEEEHSRSRSRSISNAYRSHRKMLPPPKLRHHAAGKEREIPSTSGRRPVSPDSDREATNKRLKVRPPAKEVSPRRREKVHLRPASPVLAKPRHQQPPEPAKKTKERPPAEKLRARVKIEGAKQRRNRSPSSGSDDSTSSENSIPTITATTRLTLSERFGKMAQWSVDRSNMENMKITKNSAGGDLKVMIEEGVRESPPRKYRYSPAPQGHFPEELMTQATCH